MIPSIRQSTLPVALLAALTLPPTQAATQEPDTVPAPRTAALLGPMQVEFRAGGAYIGNFFQAPTGAPREDVVTGTGETRLLLPLGMARSQAYASFGGTLYDEFDPSLALAGGARWASGIHLADGRISYRTRSPRMEVGDSLGFADVLIIDAGYRLRPLRALQIEAVAVYDRQDYGTSAQRDNQALDLGGALRYYGFGYEFLPEIGASLGSRDVVSDTEDYDQRTLWVTLRSNPTASWFLSLRYRHRLRDYATDAAAASNFGREDRRQDLTLTADYAVDERWSVTGYLSFDDAVSTKPSRTFGTQYLWTGLTYRIGGAGR
ncbi:MAG: hypothetical protein KY453_03460 [Gemmatimonadetes bacterium]|nr:hypothetical protein [Gemmatimonadota bacterium]